MAQYCAYSNIFCSCKRFSHTAIKILASGKLWLQPIEWLLLSKRCCIIYDISFIIQKPKKFLEGVQSVGVTPRQCNKELHLFLFIPLGQIGVFYLFFFTLTGSFFFVQLAVFVGITPSPGPNIAPWNFGKYAYPNYPNAKLGIHLFNYAWIEICIYDYMVVIVCIYVYIIIIYIII